VLRPFNNKKLAFGNISPQRSITKVGCRRNFRKADFVGHQPVEKMELDAAPSRAFSETTQNTGVDVEKYVTKNLLECG